MTVDMLVGCNAVENTEMASASICRERRLPPVVAAGFLLLASLVGCLFHSPAAMAEETIDEDALFSDTQTVVAVPQTGANRQPGQPKNGNSFGISGEVASVNDLVFSRGADHYIHQPDLSENVLLNNLYFDGRYHTHYRVFANLQTTSTYYKYLDDDFAGTSDARSDTDTLSRFKEFFVDTPVNNQVYIRSGKQVLQWGRCQLWNPTDMINVDKNTFIQRTGSKGGVYGVKVHIPQGTRYNLYGFLDTGTEIDPDRRGGALKFEFLQGSTEMAFSYWNKTGYRPVYGYDFSTRGFGLDIAGEASASQGYVRDVLKEQDGVLYREKGGKDWLPRASLNMGKGFKFNQQPDKIHISGEFFYNGAGYKDDIFGDDGIYTYRDPVSLNGVPLAAGDKKTFLVLSDLYEPNYYGRYYVAVFTTVNKFLTSDFTLSNNWVGNLSDGSSIFSTALHYQNIRNWYVDLITYFFTGHKNAEYTFAHESVTVQLSVGYKF